MSEKVHWSFWVIGVIGLLWNLSGVANFMGQFDAERVAAMPEEYRAIVENRPGWATAAFIVGVASGAIGCILLLMRKGLAIPFFALSLVTIVLHMIPQIFGETSLSAFMVFMTVTMPMIVALFLLWYGRRAKGLGLIS